jgi:hypothetical protein
VVAGLLLSTSLARRDQDALTAALIRYIGAYRSGGVTVLNSRTTTMSSALLFHGIAPEPRRR